MWTDIEKASELMSVHDPFGPVLNGQIDDEHRS